MPSGFGTFNPLTCCWAATNRNHITLHRIALTSSAVVAADYRLQSACRQIVFRLLNRLTTWKCLTGAADRMFRGFQESSSPSQQMKVHGHDRNDWNTVGLWAQNKSAKLNCSVKTATTLVSSCNPIIRVKANIYCLFIYRALRTKTFNNPSIFKNELLLVLAGKPRWERRFFFFGVTPKSLKCKQNN